MASRDRSRRGNWERSPFTNEAPGEIIIEVPAEPVFSQPAVGGSLLNPHAGRVFIRFH